MSPAQDPVPKLLWMSRRCGEDETLVVHGGGNSSAKGWTMDHRGRRRRVLWVKGSGSDMRTLEARHLAPLDLEALLELRTRASLSDEAMVAYLQQSLLEPQAPRGSIETLLHAVLPPAYILHTHADATAALVDNPRSAYHVRRCFGGAVGLVPYQRPGFDLSKATLELYQRGIKAGRPWRAIMLDKHGLITWGETAAEALEETRRLVGMARRYVRRRPFEARSRKAAGKGPGTPGQARLALLSSLRGSLSLGERQLLRLDRSREALAYSLRKDVKKLCLGGPATPDHLLYTKPRALFIDPSKGSSVAKAVASYRRWYDGYFKRYARKGSIQLDSAPRVVVIRGLGVVVTGKDPKVTLIARDIYRHSIWVRQKAAGLGGYSPIGLRHVGDFEYWPLENYKLSLAPAEKELSRRIALVTGAGRGIGKACALRLAAAGACVAVVDLDAGRAKAVAQAIEAQHGAGRALALKADITDERDVRRAFEAVVLEWGGLDILVNNAGIARTGAVEGLARRDWEAALEVNATGHFLCAREAAGIFRRQGLGGSVVFVSSKNVLAPGKDFAAYSASKAAQTQLAKVLALELAPLGVRVNCVTPDGVFEDSGLWEAIGPERARTQGVKPGRLKAHYMARNLLKREVRPEDVAEAVLYLASERASRTTGTLLPVDGGLREAFPR